MREGKDGTTLFGAHDNNPKRLYYHGPSVGELLQGLQALLWTYASLRVSHRRRSEPTLAER
jgi:hypothetical protein